MAIKTCTAKYSTNYSDTRGQLSVMNGVIDLDANTFTFFATAPFLILGIATYKELPEGETPNYPNSKIVIPASADQSAVAEWLQALFIAMGFANAQQVGVSNGKTAYYGPDSFANYMFRYLNPQILGAWYSTYVFPGSETIQFWKDEVIKAVPENESGDLRKFALELFNNSSLPLFNPPGKYIINLDGAVNDEPYAADMLAYLTANENVLNLIVEQQNSPDLADNDNDFVNPLANTIDSINFAGSVPDAILWD